MISGCLRTDPKASIYSPQTRPNPWGVSNPRSQSVMEEKSQKNPVIIPSKLDKISCRFQNLRRYTGRGEMCAGRGR